MVKLCSIDECGRVLYARGICRAHYKRWERDGDRFDRRPIAPHSSSYLAWETCEVAECEEAPKKLGRCNKHYLETRKSYQAQWYQANRARRIKAALDWQKANPESRAATHVKRKAQCQLPPEDQELSIEYRRAIRNDPCFYCDAPGEHDDHFVSLYNGGTDHWWNLVRACAPCNHRKNKTNGPEFMKLLEESVNA